MSHVSMTDEERLQVKELILATPGNRLHEFIAEGSETWSAFLLGEIMTLEEAVALYGLNADSAEQGCANGEIPARKSGKTWLVTQQDALAEWGSKGDQQ